MACYPPGTVRGEARKGYAQLEVAVPSSPEFTQRAEEELVGVIIGMDPHKRSATIEVIDERATVLAGGKYGTDTAGYGQMLAAARKFRGPGLGGGGLQRHRPASGAPPGS
jgi:hypothetical protein